jgi:Domain of unknown function (DUF4442)
MKPHWLHKLPQTLRSGLVRLGFNWHPAFRGTGGRIVHVSPDLRHLRVRLPHSWRTRNIVGSTFGGSLFAVTDGPHPMMLMAALGKGYIVWDKSASIRYRKPGFSTLYADFVLKESELEQIRHRLQTTSELEHTFCIELKDRQGQVHTEVDRTVYICSKSFYHDKLTRRG